ncbi:hypothetical protein ACFLZ6_01760 [Nanoarchaeota archaeon]
MTDSGPRLERPKPLEMTYANVEGPSSVRFGLRGIVLTSVLLAVLGYTSVKGHLSNAGDYIWSGFRSTTDLIGDTIYGPSDGTSDKPSDKSSTRKNVDPNRGGLEDHIFTHPDKPLLGPDEYEDDGKVVRVEKYHKTNFFSDPGQVYRAGNAPPPSESSVSLRMDIEERLTGAKLNRTKILNYLGNVINEAGRILMRQTRASSIDGANQRASDKQFHLAVAEAFRRGNAVYEVEEQLFSSFDPKLHRRKHVHFDCNMMAEAWEHVTMAYGRRADLMLQPQHMFVSTGQHEVETTAFRKQKETGEIRHNRKGTIPYELVVHTDKVNHSIFWKEKYFHFRNHCRGVGLVINDHNLRVFQEQDGMFKPLDATDKLEVIEGALRLHLINEQIKKKNFKEVERLDNEYIEFAKTVQNPWVATQGFNALAGKVNDEYERFKGDTNYTSEAVANVTRMMDAMGIYSQNHKCVEGLAKRNLRRMKLIVDYMKDPTNVDKALATFDAQSYTDEGQRQIAKYEGVIRRVHRAGSPAALAEYVFYKGLDQQVTLNLANIYFDYVARNQPGQKKAIYDALEAKKDDIMDAVKDAPERVIDNLTKLRNGDSVPLERGRNIENEWYQAMVNLCNLQNAVE